MPNGLSPRVQELVAVHLTTGLYADENKVLIDALLALQQHQENGADDAVEFEDDWHVIGVRRGQRRPMTRRQIDDALDTRPPDSRPSNGHD